jgi:imidazole glycerol phosphate synthase subunit HisF
MDEQGTNFSHYNIANDKDKIADIYSRIGVDELAISKINVMDEKITRIDTAVGKIQDNLSTKK